MKTEFTDNQNRSGSATQPAPAEEAQLLLKSLIARSKECSITPADLPLLVMLLASRLAKALGQPQDPERMAVYGERLADLDVGTLLAVFEQCEMECKFFPQISEIRERAGKLTSQLDAMDADRAWQWVTDYLGKHGVEGRDYVESEPYQGACERCGGSRWVRIVADKDGKEICSFVRCNCRRVTLREPAPNIPPRIQATLRAMAPTIERALEAIRDVEGRWVGRLRDSFNDAYSRAKAREVA